MNIINWLAIARFDTSKMHRILKKCTCKLKVGECNLAIPGGKDVCSCLGSSVGKSVSPRM